MPTLLHDPVSRTCETRIEPSAFDLGRDAASPLAEPSPNTFAQALVALAIAVLVLVAGAFRSTSLNNFPGVNGDEAWYGNLVHDILDGQPRFLTPSQIPVNPFYIVPLLVGHLFAEPSVTLLRCPALLSGLLVLFVNYWLARRYFGPVTAIVSTTMLTVLPIMIAYSRFGWDMAQMPLATACLMYACVQSLRRPSPGMTRLTWGLFLCGLLVHPTCLFLAPVSLLATINDLSRDLPARWRPLASWLTTPSAMWTGIGVLMLLGIVRHDLMAGSILPQNSLHRLSECWALFGDFFSGRTVYSYLSGGRGNELIWTVWRISLSLLTVMSLIRLARSEHTDERRLSLGLSLGIVAFFVVGGPKGLTPGYERYAMFLIVPLVLVWTRALVLTGRIQSRALQFALIVVGALQLAQFNDLYFRYIQVTGGTSRETYWTGPEELKTAAARTIAAATPADQQSLVLTSSFHCYQPLKYLLHARRSIRVELVRDRTQMDQQIATMPEATVWLVDFTTDREGVPSPLLEMAKGQAGAAFPITDFAGRESLTALKLRQNLPTRALR